MKIIPSCLLVAALAASACTYEEAALPPPQETEPPFVPIGPDGEVIEDESPGAIDGSTFYVAIHRSAFDRRWFFTTTLSQLEPDGPTGGAARSLGVRVVRLVEQNHRLFLMDDTAGDGSVLTPPRIVDDFPIVDHVPSGGGNYVMVDFARGRADFRITALGAAQARPAVIESSLLRRFRRLGDGVGFERVFTGRYTDGDGRDQAIAGTLGISLRLYADGPGYEPTAQPEAAHYFRGTDTRAARWALSPAAPIRLRLTPALAELHDHPEYGRYDLVAAVTRGAESWNEVLGFPLIAVEPGDDGDSIGDDDKNLIVFDTDGDLEGAFADHRINPATGEIRGASIYIGGTTLASAHALAGQLAGLRAPASARGAAPIAARPALQWASMQAETTCGLTIASALPPVARALAKEGELTQEAIVEHLISFVVAHEVGHVLGLRHNFKGSLAATPTSIMDYPGEQDLLGLAGPGSYDVAALRYLYGAASTLPTEPFCAEDELAIDPDCALRDATASPLTDYWGAYWSQWLPAFLAGHVSIDGWGALGPELLKYVRAGSPDQRLIAWRLLTDAVAPPVEGAHLADGLYRTILTDLYLSDPDDRGIFTDLPPADDADFEGLLLAQLVATVTNVDGGSSFETRRAAVDVLGAMQSFAAYETLFSVREVLRASSPTTDLDRALTDDLIARIGRVIDRFFE